jgi:hypothetical protein
MSTRILFALLCMAAAGSASAHVFKSVGADGKVVYSDRPSDKVNAEVSIIKADIVQTVSSPAAGIPAAEQSAPRVSTLVAAAAAGAGKERMTAMADAKIVCDKTIDVLVNRKGEIVKTLGPSGPLAAFKPH